MACVKIRPTIENSRTDAGIVLATVRSAETSFRARFTWNAVIDTGITLLTNRKYEMIVSNAAAGIEVLYQRVKGTVVILATVEPVVEC